MTNTKNLVITRQGYDRLEKELYILKHQKKQEILSQMKKAPRGYIDRDEAEARYVRWEKRVNQVEETLKFAKVIDKGSAVLQVQVGCQVRVSIEDEEIVYEIVSAVESNPAEGKISIDSPLGIALNGKHVGDLCEILTPNGHKLIYKVKEIT